LTIDFIQEQDEDIIINDGTTQLRIIEIFWQLYTLPLSLNIEHLEKITENDEVC